MKDRNWKYKWIWTKRTKSEAKIQHVCFRKEFDLIRMPTSAKIFLTADTIYRLWINGKFVMVGPARSNKGRATADVIEVKELCPGKNVITVEVFFTNVHCELFPQAPGVLCEVELKYSNGKNVLLGTDSSWRTFEPLALDERAPILGGSRAFPIEIFDGSKLKEGWNRIGFDTKGWKEAREIGKVGTGPWKIVKLRDIPLPYVGERFPQRVVDIGSRTGKTSVLAEKYNKRNYYYVLNPSKGIPKENEVALLMQTEEVRPLSGNITNISGAIGQNDNPTVIKGVKGLDTYIMYDFGTEVAGFVQFEVEGPKGVKVDVGWTDWIRSKDGTIRPQDYNLFNPVLRYKMRKGRQIFESIYPQSFRFLNLVIRGAGSYPVKLHKVGVREYRFPFQSAGSFFCSDPKLNKIFEAARLTLSLNVVDAFMDCPNRERGAYIGEPYWPAQAAFYLFGDLSVNRRMCRMGAETQGFIKKLPGMISTIIASNAPEHSMYFDAGELIWILQIALDYEYTGDMSLIRELAPNIEKMISQFEKFKNKEGLLEQVPTRGHFLDWSLMIGEGDVFVGLNCIYAKTLEKLAALLKNKKYLKRAKEIKEAINLLIPDSDTNISPDRPPFYPDVFRRRNGKLEPFYPFCSETTQNYALWTGLADKKRALALWEVLRDSLSPFPEKRPYDVFYKHVTSGGGYSFFQRLQFAASIGDYETMLRDIRQQFGYMVDRGPGTLWEQFHEESWSMCHGYTSGVAAILMEEVLGIKSGIKGGFKNFRISPHGDGELKWVRGYVTTQEGIVNISWHHGREEYRLNIGLPSGCKAEVILPVEAMNIWVKEKDRLREWPQKLKIKSSSIITVCPGRIEITPFLPKGKS